MPAVLDRCRRVARGLPAPVRTRLHRLVSRPGLRRRLRPVRWGNVRRKAPFSGRYGFDRGTPVDRLYLHAFFGAHGDDIRGRVLEVDAPEFCERHGAPDRVEIVDIDGRNDRATIVADLAAPRSLPTESFDCILLPQTLQYVDDPLVAVANLWQALAPGGVLLVTVPAAAKVDHHARAVDRWRWLPRGLEQLLMLGCPGADVTVTGFGNAMAAGAFLLGAAVEDVGAARLQVIDDDVPMLAAARVRKPVHA